MPTLSRKYSPLLFLISSVTFGGDCAQVSQQLIAIQLHIPGCENVYQVTDRILTGGVPQDNTSFASLAGLGVKTIISVDGVKPNIASAKAAGIRYIHLPIRYNDVPRTHTLHVLRVLREIPGKAYIHCHHGKHRSPAMTAAVMAAGLQWSTQQAIAFMKQAGTGSEYPGLYKAVSTTQPASEREIVETNATFPEIAVVSDLVQSMTALDEHIHQLMKIEDGNWSVPSESPDIVPVHEAIQLVELFTEQVRMTTHEEPGFVRLMRESRAHATTLKTAIQESDLTTASATLAKIKAACVECHAAYRDRYAAQD